MPTYTLSRTLHWQGQISEKAAQVCRMFGLTADRLAERSVRHNCQVEINDGDIVYITGPSGAGKSIVLNELAKSVPAQDMVSLDQIELADSADLPSPAEAGYAKAGAAAPRPAELVAKPQAAKAGPAEKTLIDYVDGDFVTSLRILSTAGLGDVFCILSRPANLSDGQKYRFRLAMALATGKKFVFADEFCSNLDRITAAVISYNVHKFAKRNGVTFILASSHKDILLDLAPDVLIVKELCGPTQVIYKGRNPA
jgi:ABC-type ATPase with predicted acetyltransferase domain